MDGFLASVLQDIEVEEAETDDEAEPEPEGTDTAQETGFIGRMFSKLLGKADEAEPEPSKSPQPAQAQTASSQQQQQHKEARRQRQRQRQQAEEKEAGGQLHHPVVLPFACAPCQPQPHPAHSQLLPASTVMGTRISYLNRMIPPVLPGNQQHMRHGSAASNARCTFQRCASAWAASSAG